MNDYKNSNRKFLKRADSSGALANFSWSPGQQTVFPNFSPADVLTLIDTDPVARGALTHFVDKSMEGDYALIERETKKYDRDAELRLDENYKFRSEILRKIFIMLKLYNNAFLELVKDTSGRTKAMNVLDASMIEPETEPNGDPIRYHWKVENPITGEKAKWDKSEIVWFKLNDRSQGWAPVDIKALSENLHIKQYIRRYIGWLWKTGQYRLLYKFKDSSKQDITDFLVYAKRNDKYYDVPFVAKGDIETTLLRDMKEIDQLVSMMKYLDNQTLILMRIPPNDAGIPDASGRSNADAQSNNLYTTITSVKKVIEDTINFDLFPRINKGTYLFHFAPNDRFAEKQVFEIVKLMKDMGMDDDVCKEYMEDRGMYFAAERLFKEPTGMEAAVGGLKQERYTKGTGEGNKPREEPTTREDQLRRV